MIPDDLGLCQDVLAVFRRACSERQFEVAEYLLLALEAVDGAGHTRDDFRRPEVVAAYRILADLPEA